MSLEAFQKEYETDISDLTVRDKVFRFFVPKSIDRFIGPEDVFQEFPLWAKIWKASVVLADYLAAREADTSRRFLEIGCGLGVVGIVAASFGHRVTMTEYDQNALDFARANAELNGVEKALEIVALDWNDPQMEGVFDCIVGSEVIYSERDYQPIQRLLNTYLVPEGEIILVEGVRKTSMEFFRQMQPLFEVKGQKLTLRSREEEIPLILCRMRFRNTGPLS